MLFRYTGQLTDSIAYDEQDYYFNPDSEIDLPDKLVEFPYIARMVQTGLLKAVSKSAPDSEEALVSEPVPEPAPEPTPAPAPAQ